MWESSSTVCDHDLASLKGSGTLQDPFIVNWDDKDPENPLSFPNSKKWIITSQLAFCTWTVSFSSSVYSAGLESMARELRVSESVAILGLSLYVLGFALGPLMFAPLGEIYGRRLVFLITFVACTVFQLQGCLARDSIAALLSCRLLTGIFGSSSLVNAPAQISDLWDSKERGRATSIYNTFPFLGPIIGPIVGGYVVTTLGWRFNFWLQFIFTALSLLTGAVLTPETYAPVLLRRRASKLTRQSNGILHFVSIHDQFSASRTMFSDFARPFVFLVTEPIVLCTGFYIALAYGSLYSLFAAFPIVFQQHHHFTSAQGGLVFCGLGIGILLGLASTPIQNRIYCRASQKSETKRAAPEARLHQAMFGGALVPLGLFWFAFSVSPSVHWLIPVIGSAVFGIGISAILQSLTSYLMDTYDVYFASAVASTIVLRSVCAATMPLTVPIMFSHLGDMGAMVVLGALGLACAPIPFLLWRYGQWIRTKSSIAFKEKTTDMP
ncbi:MFS general substrate transporter [Roridomyces roridus]|uniref:MFS general substrate transporter n=1 Tax=Roridomyces roridus TaxID=1738132 RepID=A0AAD7BW13_9AGAR|nr:MFS general substrate transporter [Roridomyces roridus]